MDQPRLRTRERDAAGGGEAAGCAAARGSPPEVDSRGTAALHAIRFAAAILQPAVPGTQEPPSPERTARLLELAGNWREAALELGEFAPAGPVLRIILDEKGR
ncbi:hypothetical protein [Kitasatospora aureofaciens]|uniref:hypothetical protein n=1 Tax=Kitasatospora aureofaciens TaxID=1894 RepID=UPI0037CA88CC